MAEMTAAEAVKLVKNPYRVAWRKDWLTHPLAEQIAALIEQLEQQLAAANARIAKLEKDNARQKRLATISRLCKNVQSYRAEKAEEKIKQMEDAIKFDFERFMDFQQRAEQAEAQNKRMQTAINRYAIGNIELLDAMKAALEGKE